MLACSGSQLELLYSHDMPHPPQTSTQFRGLFKLQTFPISPFALSVWMLICISTAACSIIPTNTQAPTFMLQQTVLRYLLVTTQDFFVIIPARSDEVRAQTPKYNYGLLL